jgi:tRNA threonylcarbamoyladenosine biosynthesis protein TsaE
MKKTFHIAQESSLKEVATFIESYFTQPTFFAFEGEMGAGKTTTISYLLKAFGIESFQGSPTYAIVQEYVNSAQNKFYHLDCYRLENENDALQIGLDELFEENAWFFIEWAKNIHFLLPDNLIWVYIRSDEITQQRTITIES